LVEHSDSRVERLVLLSSNPISELKIHKNTSKQVIKF
jgi:hypothetical protein